jgi:preprotein translocase subunit SecE
MAAVPSPKVERPTAKAQASKVPRPTARPEAKTTKQENPITRYIYETRAELRKVVWPSRREWINLTTVVVIVTVVAGIFLGLVDYIFERLILLLVR